MPATKQKDKLITAADQIDNVIQPSTWRRIFTYSGGVKTCLPFVLVLWFSNWISTYQEYVVQSWADLPPEAQQSQFTGYICVILLILTIVALIMIGTQIAQNTMTFRTTKNLFQMMIDRLMCAPINLYFDITPISRILSVFNRELYGIQISFFQIFSDFFSTIIAAVTTVLLTMYAAPVLLIVIVYMVFRSYQIFFYFKPAIKESERLAQSTNAPI